MAAQSRKESAISEVTSSNPCGCDSMARASKSRSEVRNTGGIISEEEAKIKAELAEEIEKALQKEIEQQISTLTRRLEDLCHQAKSEISVKKPSFFLLKLFYYMVSVHFFLDMPLLFHLMAAMNENKRILLTILKLFYGLNANISVRLFAGDSDAIEKPLFPAGILCSSLKASHTIFGVDKYKVTGMGMAFAGLDNEQEKGGATLIDFGSPDTVEKIKNLTDGSAMKRFLHECIAYQRNIDAELETLLSQRHEVEKKLSGLQKSSEVLEIVKADSDQMLLSVCSTCDLADHVSGKVRELDLAQSRVQSTLTRIDDIVERGNCIDGAKQALECEDYEGAARYVETFMKLDDKYGDSNDMGSGGRETAKEQTNQLLESKQKLEGIVKKQISSAIEKRDHPSILRFIKLFPHLGLQEEGLQLYVSYLRKDVSLRSRLEFEGLMEIAEQSTGQAGVQTQADFVGCLTNLFKDIVLAIEGNDEILRSLCGVDGIVHAIWELQEECNSRGSVILKKYMDYRKLARLASEINSQTNSLISVVGTQEGPDPREIELYLEEILSLTQLSEDYTQFMMTKLREVGSVDAQLSPRASNAFRSGAFSRAAKELTGYYIILEEFFMVENVRKAITIDEFIPDGLTTSMVDDVFYVLQSCCRRATSTSSVQSVLAVLNGAINVLNNEFTEALQRKTREPNLGSKLFLVGGGLSKIGTEIATSLNNLDVSSEYVLKLRHEIEEYCAEAFPASADREKVKSCLSELAETNNTFKQVLNAGLEQLASSITPRLRPILDTVATISYELSEMQYAENEINDPWVQKILLAVETNVTWLQPAMTTNNYDSLVHLIIDFIVKRLEVIMTQKRFNQLGGLQLDRDARTLVGHFSSMTQRTVRDKFARLTQMATILNLEKVSEILDYWGENSGPMTWRLTPAEVRRILSLRVDFKPEAIAALKL